MRISRSLFDAWRRSTLTTRSCYMMQSTVAGSIRLKMIPLSMKILFIVLGNPHGLVLTTRANWYCIILIGLVICFRLALLIPLDRLKIVTILIVAIGIRMRKSLILLCIGIGKDMKVKQLWHPLIWIICSLSRPLMARVKVNALRTLLQWPIIALISS